MNNDPLKGVYSCFGWKRPDMLVMLFRCRMADSFSPNYNLPVDMARLLPPSTIINSYRGFGHFGVDFWPVLKNAKGEKVGGLVNRYPKSNWALLTLPVKEYCPPGPDGAMASARLELMREGLQEAEARIVIEEALADPARRGKLGDAVARKCQDALDEHALGLLPVLEEQEVAGYAARLRCKMDGYSYANYNGWIAGIFRQWYMESGWQERSEKLFEAAAEVCAARR